jgi:transcription termination/antitermination protein NusA
MRTEFMAAMNQVASERGIDVNIILEALQHALVAAFKRDFGEIPEEEELWADVDPDTGEVKIMHEGKDVTPAGFGRIAAQTAKQVILQRIREAEKEAIMADFEKKVGTVISAMVQRKEGPNWMLDIGRTIGVMPPSEQVYGENYRLNQRLKVYVSEIKESPRGGQEIILSRSHPNLLAALFELEVPEVAAGSVEIKGIAREAGFRSKVAVTSNQDGVDPVGSCVGQKGVRVQAITNELNGEKLDLILWSPDAARYIVASLSPAKAIDIEVNSEEKTAKVTVLDDQLSLAIGKEGQNVRLAAKLTGYRIDIIGETDAINAESSESAEAKSDEVEVVAEDEIKATVEAQKEAGEPAEIEEVKAEVEAEQATEEKIEEIIEETPVVEEVAEEAPKKKATKKVAK